MHSLDKSQLEEEEEKVTRETAAYNRLEAILRVTKPLCEKQIDEFEEHDEDNQIHKQSKCLRYLVGWSISTMDMMTMVRVFLSSLVERKKKDTMINVRISILIFPKKKIDNFN